LSNVEESFTLLIKKIQDLKLVKAKREANESTVCFI